MKKILSVMSALLISTVAATAQADFNETYKIINDETYFVTMESRSTPVWLADHVLDQYESDAEITFHAPKASGLLTKTDSFQVIPALASTPANSSNFYLNQDISADFHYVSGDKSFFDASSHMSFL